MKDNNEPVRWSKEKKAQREQEIEQRDQLARKKKAMLLVHNLYLRWQKAFVRKEKSKEEIMEALEDLKDQCHKAVKDAAPEWLRFTDDMIQTKVGQIIAGTIAEVNNLKEIVPSTAKGVVPHEARIRSNEEFLSLLFVKRISEKDGFVGFLRHFPQVMALFADGEVFPIATCTSEIGLMEYRTLGEYAAEFAKEQRKN